MPANVRLLIACCQSPLKDETEESSPTSGGDRIALDSFSRAHFRPEYTSHDVDSIPFAEVTSASPHPFSFQYPRFPIFDPLSTKPSVYIGPRPRDFSSLPICDIQNTRPSPFLRPRPRPFLSSLRRKTTGGEISPQQKKKRVSFVNCFFHARYTGPIPTRMGRYAPLLGGPHNIFYKTLRCARTKVMNAAASLHSAPAIWNEERFWNGELTIEISPVETQRYLQAKTERKERTEKKGHTRHRARHMQRWLERCFRRTFFDVASRSKEAGAERDPKFAFHYNYSITQRNYNYSCMGSTFSINYDRPSKAEEERDKSRSTVMQLQKRWWIHGKSSPGKDSPERLISSTPSRSEFLNPLRIRQMQLFMRQWLAPSGPPLTHSDMATFSANDAHKSRRKCPPIRLDLARLLICKRLLEIGLFEHLMGKSRLEMGMRKPTVHHTPPMMLTFLKKCREQGLKKELVARKRNPWLPQRISNISQVLREADSQQYEELNDELNNLKLASFT